MNDRFVKTILILAANPKNSAPLRLDQEVKEIGEGLRRSEQRDKFQLEQAWAVTPSDVQRAMLDHHPQIVHFSGHGVGEGGLVLENPAGQAQLVGSKALAGMFRLFADNVECVVLNACYSEVQAIEIVQHIPYVIGMNQAVGDRAARLFAVAFYDALGAGESIEFAYELGCNRMALEGSAEDCIPVIKRKSEIGDVPPAPPIVLDEPEGQVPLESTLYVERPPMETRCYEAIVKPGALIRIKAPRQMGKSSLMLRILQDAKQQEYQTASLNFQLVDRDALGSLDAFLQWFCHSLAEELNLEDRLADYWKGALGCKNKCTNYVQRYLLPTLQRPIVLCLDDVDQVFEYPTIATDFFGMLRAWHENAKIKPIWQHLRLVIVHSREVYIPLDINQSPFNVGVPIELLQFTQPQVMDLAQRHPLHWGDAEVARLMGMVGGHPFLVRVALYQIARGETLERLLKTAPTEGGLYGEHLRRHFLNLEGDGQLLAAMKQMVSVDHPVSLNPTQAFRLHSLGLVRFQGNDVVLSCDLYRLYFREQLGREQLGAGA